MLNNGDKRLSFHMQRRKTTMKEAVRLRKQKIILYKMSRVQHNRVLPTTFSFAVYMFLLIHLGYSGFYGSDCRRSCWGHCFNGRCALLASGRAVNCTEGCVLGWRGLTCTTRCKRPCLKCDRNTGDCVGQCRDGFCGAGCLQRCPNKSYVMPRTLKLTHALGQTHGTEKEGSNPNPCAEKFTNTCVKCNECNECREGYYGSSCEKKCIGHCQYDCDIQTGLCRTCQDGFHGDNCSVPCSNTCFENACERSTGACNGCKEGYCSPYTGCEQSCDRNCSTCDFETCKCLTPASQDTTSPTSSSKAIKLKMNKMNQVQETPCPGHGMSPGTTRETTRRTQEQAVATLCNPQNEKPHC
ncbi:scavenger receptor class F member 1-like isoform X3 [Haliotis asinina]|uniref:scavenger receptor class F member 1-like isoform X3 n=2 Tax=Haliotis asinina TaxID=109174 RepID=UPI00353204DC